MYLVEKKVKLAIHLLDATRQEQQHVVKMCLGGGGRGQSVSIMSWYAKMVLVKQF
jgi:hypothetical protein